MESPKPSRSIGMAVFSHGAVEYADLFRYADTALYERKEKGCNGVNVYDKATDKDNTERGGEA